MRWGRATTTLARKRATNALIYGVVFGALFAALVWSNLPALAALMGATGETLDLAVGYLQIIVPSLPFLMVGMVGGAILRAHGDARRAMMATIWGGLVNAVLDPILIFGLDLELTGAALASCRSADHHRRYRAAAADPPLRRVRASRCAQPDAPICPRFWSSPSPRS